MTGGERLAKVAEVLAGHCDRCNGLGITVQGWTDKHGEPEEQFGPCAACRRRNDALAPLLDTFRAEDEARGAGRVREVFAALLPGFEADYGVQSSPVARLRAALADGEGGGE